MPTKILLIEDELFIRELYEHLFKKLDFSVTTAVDGIDGLEKAKDQPSLILLDIMMPKINGLDVLKRLKGNSETKDIPVVLLTNLGQEEIVKEALKIGARGYILKARFSPFEIADLIQNFIKDPNFTISSVD